VRGDNGHQDSWDVVRAPASKHGGLLSTALVVQSAVLFAHNLLPMLLNISGSNIEREQA